MPMLYCRSVYSLVIFGLRRRRSRFAPLQISVIKKDNLALPSSYYHYQGGIYRMPKVVAIERDCNAAIAAGRAAKK